MDISSLKEFQISCKYVFQYDILKLKVAKLFLQQNPQHYYIFAIKKLIKLRKIYNKKYQIARLL